MKRPVEDRPPGGRRRLLGLAAVQLSPASPCSTWTRSSPGCRHCGRTCSSHGRSSSRSLAWIARSLMIDTWVIVVASVAYLALLFAIAYFGDRRADRGRSIISNGYIYALSLGVYAIVLDLLRQRRPGRDHRRRFPADLPRARRSWRPAWWLVLRKIIRICKQQPDHLPRRLHLLAIRQERRARRTRHRHRRGRDRPVHRAAAQGHLQLVHDPARRARAGHDGRGRPADPDRHGALRRAAARRLHDRLRHPPPGRHRAARGHGRGHRVRVAGQAGRVPRRRLLRHVRELPWVRRPVRPCPLRSRPGPLAQVR